jgi:hypothetical protein
MPSTNRRTVLATLGTVSLGGLAGCSFRQSDEHPAGSLTFANKSDLPHSITMRVTDVGEEPGEQPYSVTGETTTRPAQRTLTASTTISPGARETYEGVFTEPVWYAIQFTADGQTPPDSSGRVVYSPAPDTDSTGRTLRGTIGSNGEFRWGISATENAGRFDL